MLIVGALLVLVVIGAVGFVLFGDDDDGDRPPVTLPTATIPSLSTDLPTSTPTTPGTGGDPSSVLKPTIQTARGNTFTQVGTRTDTCTARANSTLLTRLRTYPCIGTMKSAVYASPTRNIVTVISIMEVSSSTAARSISSATYSKGWPKLLKPSTTSGLPQLNQEPSYWTRTWTLDSRVIYAQSYWARGGSIGDRSGSVYTTAGELGVEITNTLRFTN
ncbi:hypothetical protein GCM10023085_59320 [Actinomadura viridis]|uniref:Uncharacterized protein n=1 Tax=Actinomadura viridis TaxID=58110 RepID=A0A931GUK8_9ACTN|nr:hypothetical protein [Actinomadura viridis]MBG6093274.1 hypothetical protein [Actinomadura viridis]